MRKAPGTFGGSVTVGPAKAQVEDSVGEWQQRLCVKRPSEAGGRLELGGARATTHRARGEEGVEKVSQDRDPSDGGWQGHVREKTKAPLGANR